MRFLLLMVSLLLVLGMPSTVAAARYKAICVVTPASAPAGSVVRLDVFDTGLRSGDIVAYDTGPTTVQVNALGVWLGDWSHEWSFFTVQQDPGKHVVSIYSILTRPSGKLLATCSYLAT